MSDPFARLIPEARAFLSALAAENTRDWFAAHRDEYEARLKRPAELLLDQVAADLGRMLGMPAATKLFRPQRDVRFSKDKTPYTTHLHLAWSPSAAGMAEAGFFFGIAPEYVTLGAGVMAFDRERLERWRQAVAGPDGEAIATEIEALASLGFTPREAELKRVPAPFPPDHPRAGLLRRKGLVLWRNLDERAFSSPVATLTSDFSTLAPLVRRLVAI